MTLFFKYVFNTKIADIFSDIGEYNKLCKFIDTAKRRVDIFNDSLYTGRVYWEPQIKACMTEVFRKKSDMDTVVSAMPKFIEKCELYDEHNACNVANCPFYVYNQRHANAVTQLKKLQARKKAFWGNKFANVNNGK